MSKSIRFTLLGGLLVVLGLIAAPAQASSGWAPANAGTSVSNGVITMDTTDAGVTPAGTSLENADLGRTLAAGDVISFEYKLDGASCGGGQPRIFVEIGGVYTNTFNGNPDACGTAIGDGWFRVVFDAPEGTVGHAGIVFDNPSDRGVAQIRNVVIGTPIFPSSKDTCKQNAWAGAGYRNQGQCVSSFAR